MPRPALVIAKRGRAFRRALTELEVMLWSRLKQRGTGKPIFSRPQAFGTIIFDFYCVPAKLAVEIDGATHWSDESRAKDEARNIWAMWQGIEVLRIVRARSIATLAALRMALSGALARIVSR